MDAASSQPRLSIDSASKLVAVALVFLYLSGFLITSLHDFQYGFSELDPLRPRILAAGGWFTIMLTVPFALVWELKRHSAWTAKSSIIDRASALLLAYMGSALFLSANSSYVFTFDYGVAPPVTTPWWQVLLIVLAGIVLSIAATFFLIRKYGQQFKNWFVYIFTLGFWGVILSDACFRVMVKHQFVSSAITLWLFAVGAVFCFELVTRDWRFKVGFWQRTLVVFFVLLTMFSTFYYPHIDAKWGGGAPLPIYLVVSQSGGARPGKQVACTLIDETDSGYFVVVKGETAATFIPRREVAYIFFGKQTDHSMFTESSASSSSPATPYRIPAHPNPARTRQAASSAVPLSSKNK
jgi:hypothetical protein